MRAEERHAQLAKDEKDLHKFGYAQQLLRDMGGFANFAVSFTIISTVTGTIQLFGHGLTYGGPAANGIGWPIVTFFTLAVTASMAEIASAIPTAGAMYHWSSLLGGPGWGWFTAWFNFVGQVATTAGVDYGIATFMQTLLGIQGQTSLLTIYALVLASHGLVNHYGIKAVALLNDVSVWYHMEMTALIIVLFSFFVPHKPLSYAFTTGLTASAFPYRWAFMIGLLQAQWTMTGYDASAHITEETLDPRRNAPWGMFNSVLISGLCAYPMLLALTLGVGDLKAVVGAENAFLYVAQSGLGAVGGKALVWLSLGVMWLCGLSCLTTNARMVFAFSRDKGMLGWKKWSTVSAKYRTPAAAIWLCAAVAFAIGLYSQAVAVIVSLSTIGLYISYVIPIVLVLRARSRGEWAAQLGPWTLRRWGALVNAVAVAWVCVITVLFVYPWPTNEKTGYTFAGLALALCVYYFASVRGVFEGPKKLGTEEDLMRLEAELQKTSLYRES